MDVDKDGREEISVEGGNFGDVLFVHCYFKIMKRTKKRNSLKKQIVFFKIDNFECSEEKQEREKTEFT